MNILVDGQTLQSAERNRGIGVYFKNLLAHMVKGSYEHSWYITTSDAASLNSLDPWVAKRVKPVVNSLFAPGFEYGRTGEYTAALAKVVAEQEIDVYWNPNPLMVNVLFPNASLGCPFFLTVYDLIPLVMPVADWSAEVQDEYARRIAFIKALPEARLMGISQATLQDMQTCIGKNSNARIVCAAANKQLFYTPRTTGGINEEPSLLFTGGFDYRKNIHGAVKAFHRALEKYPGNPHLQKAKFTIVCNCERQQKWAFYDELQAMGLLGRVRLTGFIPDEELSALYAGADVFFFPSLYEGFGLPLLEAMLGGAYVVSADNSSLPEVCGPHGLLCNAEDIEAMADALNEGFLRAAAESVEDKQARQAYALGFSWEKAAGETLDYFKSALEPAKTPAQRLKIAMVTPWPNQKTGIANYVYQLMPYFSRYFDVDIFVDDTQDKAALVENKWGNLYSIAQLGEKRQGYDEVLYQFGNSAAHHTGIYEAAKQYGGIGEVHDFILHHFFLHTYFLKGETGKYREALETAYGTEGLAHYKEVEARGGAPDDIAYPMADVVGKICKATLFHNNFSRDSVRDTKNVFVIPHASFPKLDIEEAKLAELQVGLRGKYGLRENAFLVGAMGFVNKPKRPGQLLQAIKRLKEKGHDVQMLFLGQADDDELLGYVEENGLQKDVVVTSYLAKEEYEAGLALCDVIANLRYPSMGESSGTLCEAFRYAKPVLVSEVNQYTEFPDEVCWKVPVDEYEVPVLACMLAHLADNPETRVAMGANALHYADTVLNPERIAGLYNEILQKITNK